MSERFERPGTRDSDLLQPFCKISLNNRAPAPGTRLFKFNSNEYFRAKCSCTVWLSPLPGIKLKKKKVRIDSINFHVSFICQSIAIFFFQKTYKNILILIKYHKD